MSPLLDPTLCPDCRSLLDDRATCTGCGLVLTGPLAGELWQTMNRAATLVAALRRQPAAATAPGRHHLPAAPPVPARPRRSTPGASIPAVLFGVGALCLLVAAIVFVAVAWSSLGLGARTSILLGVTLGFGTAAVVLTRRGLRGAAETFWLVTSALVTIDLVAGHGAGLLGFDAVSDRHATGVTGGVLLVLGLAASTWARTTPLGTLSGAGVVAVLGALVVAASEAWTAGAIAPATTISILVLAALAAFARANGLTVPAYGLAGLAATGWLVLVGEGLRRAVRITPGDWWADARGWPLPVAAGLAALVVLPRTWPTAVRATAAGASLAGASMFVLAPATAASTRMVLAAAVLVALAATAAFASRAWSLAAGTLTALGVVVLGLVQLVRPVLVAGSVPVRPTGGTDVVVPAVESSLAGWTAVVTAAALALAVLALARYLGSGTRAIALRSWYVLAPALLAVGTATAVLESGPGLVVAVAAWAGVLALLGMLAAAVRGAWATPTAVAAGYVALVGLRLAAPSELLLALFATGLVTGLAIGYRRTAAGAELRAVLLVGATLAAGTAATQWPAVLDAGADGPAVTLVVAMLAAGLLAKRITRAEPDRVCVELSALVLALTGCALPDDPTTVSVLLTLTGTAVALTSVLHPERDEVAWMGVLVLGGAAVVRIGEHLTLPEVATAPAAALLLAAGVRRLLLDPATGSRRALGSGLVLALGPTVVLVAEQPVSPRSVVLGALGVAFLTVGAARRWSAPLYAGGGALAVLALVHLGPVAAGLPRWISLGALGLALLAAAVTWEDRRRDLAAAERYLDALR